MLAIISIWKPRRRVQTQVYSIAFLVRWMWTFEHVTIYRPPQRLPRAVPTVRLHFCPQLMAYSKSLKLTWPSESWSTSLESETRSYLQVICITLMHQEHTTSDYIWAFMWEAPIYLLEGQGLCLFFPYIGKWDGKKKVFTKTYGNNVFNPFKEMKPNAQVMYEKQEWGFLWSSFKFFLWYISKSICIPQRKWRINQ